MKRTISTVPALLLALSLIGQAAPGAGVEDLTVLPPLVDGVAPSRVDDCRQCLDVDDVVWVEPHAA